MKTLREMGERAAIRCLSKKLFPAVTEIVGIGDDAAVMRDDDMNADLVFTSDPVIEGTHFTIDAPPDGIGHKAVGRVLSDLAAMGAEPLWLLINVVAPPQMPFEKLEEIYAGASELALHHGVAIIGGDMAASVTLALHVFGGGKLPKDTAVCRDGASVGDSIYVTGDLGGSIRNKHLYFEPRVTEGVWLRENEWAAAMIDVSDGLVGDLRHLIDCSNVGAELDASAIPVSESARSMNDEQSALDHAFNDGEDFELLFTVRKDKAAAFERAWTEEFDLPCTKIGKINDKLGVISCRHDDALNILIGRSGYEHYTGS